eukprot:superscaffoldBa00001138_g9141
MSRLSFHKGVQAPSSVLPVLSCFVKAQTRRGISLHSSTRNKSSPEERDGGQTSVSKYQSGSPKPSAAQKVKDAGRDFTYLIVVLIGLGVTGGLLYVVFQELFSTSSPNKIYGKAFDKVRLHPEVIGAFGEPIKCYGETTRRGRRQQVSHLEYLKDGLKHMRLKFYIEGSEPGRKGTVHSESKEQTSVWPSWYGVQDDLSIEEPSTALPPAASFSNLDMPPPYEAVSGEDDLKPPPYSECAHGA